MANTLADLETRVQDYLDKEVDEAGRFTQTRLDRAINDGYIDFCNKTRSKNRTASVTTVVSQSAYDLPDDMLRPVRIVYNDTELTPTTYDALNRERVGWQEEDAGTPDSWYINAAGSIAVVPAPSVNTYALSVFGEIVPSDVTGGLALLSASTDTPALPYPYQVAPALYAVAYLAAHIFSGDAEAQASGQLAAAEYDDMIGDFIGSLVNESAYLK